MNESQKEDYFPFYLNPTCPSELAAYSLNKTKGNQVTSTASLISFHTSKALWLPFYHGNVPETNSEAFSGAGGKPVTNPFTQKREQLLEEECISFHLINGRAIWGLNYILMAPSHDSYSSN